MKDTIDILVDQTDDFVLVSGNLVVETDTYKNMFLNAERRLSARATDNIFITEISAGIESLLQSRINDILLSDIETNIRSTLAQYDLLSNKDYDVLFNVEDDKIGIMLKFNLPSSSDNTLSIFIDRLNQRAYR
jgi:hypothetical protein